MKIKEPFSSVIAFIGGIIAISIYCFFTLLFRDKNADEDL